MKRSKLARLAALACAGVLMVAALAGCGSQQPTQADQEQTQNRQYMTQVNQTMEDLQSKLGSFNDAVSRDDVVGMRTQADNAFKAIDSLSSIDAPDSLKDIKQSYVDGANDLKSALSAYVDLYTEIDSATADHPFDYSTYDQRLSDIKAQYDSGIQKLQDGDQKVANMPN